MNTRLLSKQSKLARTVISLALLAGLVVIQTVPFSALQAKSEPAHAAAELKPIDINDGFAELVAAVKPAVVNISITGNTASKSPVPGNRFNQDEQLEQFFKRFFEHRGESPDSQPYQRKTTAAGSGFVIDSSGLVVTNHHVVKDAGEIEVVFDDGKRLPATIKGVDKKTDLALLQVKTDQILPYVKFGDSEQTEVGDWVIAIGNPFGLGGTTTSGIVSARGRNINSGPLDDFIQIDAPINRGNSGGPLFNTSGEVIGINSMIYSPNGGSVGIGFAIPAQQAASVIRQLADSGVVRRGFLGVHIQTVNDELAQSLGLDQAAGALVTKVVANSPANAAGIEVGDVILKFNGKDVQKMRDLPKLVANTSGNEQVSMEIWRGHKTITLKAVVGNDNTNLTALNDGSESSNSDRLGLVVAPLNDQNRERYGLDQETDGVVVVDVKPDSNAAKKGLRTGDVIKRVDQATINTPDDVKNAVSASHEAKKKSVLLLVERDNNAQYIVVPMSS